MCGETRCMFSSLWRISGLWETRWKAAGTKIINTGETVLYLGYTAGIKCRSLWRSGPGTSKEAREALIEREVASSRILTATILLRAAATLRGVALFTACQQDSRHEASFLASCTLMPKCLCRVFTSILVGPWPSFRQPRLPPLSFPNHCDAWPTGRILISGSWRCTGASFIQRSAHAVCQHDYTFLVHGILRTCFISFKTSLHLSIGKIIHCIQTVKRSWASCVKAEHRFTKLYHRHKNTTFLWNSNRLRQVHSKYKAQSTLSLRLLLGRMSNFVSGRNYKVN